MLAGPNGRRIGCFAAVPSTSGENCNSYHATAEEDIEHEAEEREEGDAPKEASEDDGESGVDDCGP